MNEFTSRPRRLKLGGKQQVKIMRHGASQSIRLGRNKRCDLRIQGKHVSRLHAAVEDRADGFYLVDHSSNGTFVLHESGKTYRLRSGVAARLEGAGLISLGDRVDPANPDLIRYRCES